MHLRGVIATITLLLCTVPAAAKESPKAGVQFFEARIRPVLLAHCYQCHSAEARKKRGGLQLDTKAGLLRGGDSGPAIVPGKPIASLLIKAIRHDELAMPPKKKLPAAVIRDFVKWVEMGAPDPRDGKSPAAADTTDASKGRNFWAFQPPTAHSPPNTRDTTWPLGPIDRFILARLESAGLRPAPDADRATLLRRATLDLTGLPPTPDAIDAFVQDQSPDAFSRVVDRLLASPHYGERWGRHWLDVARYADSNGKDENLTFHEAYLYRDHVIASFNRDKPYDKLLREHIAGDLLPFANQSQREEQLTATGFLVIGPKVLADRDVVRRKMDVIDEQLDTIGRTFLGLTLGCARCHDHKFDPVPTADYYALAGILASTRTLAGFKLNNPVVSGWMLRPLDTQSEKRMAQQQTWLAQVKKIGDQLRKAKADLKNPGARQTVAQLEAEEKKLRAAKPEPPRLVMAVADEPAPADIRIANRGNPHTPGKTVPRGFLRVASWGPPPNIKDHSGRVELANWLADTRNPLTARVLVNRVWQHLVGEGLVRTVDNFGVQGERPSHPELLDTLTVDFMKDGWSIKQLIRRIMLSRTYRMAVVLDAKSARVDSTNRLLWSAHRRRLEAEAIRDSILFVSGHLDRTMGGSAVAGLGEQAINNNSQGGLATERNLRRSVYLPVVRNDLPAIFEVFDFADPDVAIGRRDTTTVSTQALYLMNSPFVQEQARAAAKRLLAETASDADRLGTLYRRALGRTPTTEETRKALAFVSEYRKELKGRPANADVVAWAAVCQAVFGCTEFRFVE